MKYHDRYGDELLVDWVLWKREEEEEEEEDA